MPKMDRSLDDLIINILNWKKDIKTSKSDLIKPKTIDERIKMVSKILLSHLEEKIDKQTLINNFFLKFSVTIFFYFRSTIFLVVIKSPASTL